VTNLANAKIPESVRALATDGNKLRFALVEMAAGIKDTILLGRGDPDLPTPQHIMEAAQRTIIDGKTSPTPVAGLPELREHIAAKFRRDNGLDFIQPENVIVTTGGQEGLFLIMQTILNPGDEVICPDPRYTVYDDAIQHARGVVVEFPTDHDDAFNMRPERIEAVITPRTKAILVVTPSNPTSGIVTEDRLRAIAEIAQRHNLIVISDEIYERFTYDGWKHFSIGSFPGMAERTITLNGFSKAYAMTGWRVGYVAAPKNVIDAMIKVKAITSGPAATISQVASVAALTGPDVVADFLRIYTERRALVTAALTDMGLSYSDSRGAFFAWTNSSSTGIHAMELAYLLLQEGKILIFPGNAFGPNWGGYLRVSFLQDTELLREAMVRMRPIIERYRSA
jgi:aminotransferase